MSNYSLKDINLLTQDELINQWVGNKDEINPLVTISCTAFNHGKFIEDTIKGFLIQQTNFPFEVIIHDDASVDNTRDIIEEYRERYPKIIKPIYQKNNVYSKGLRPANFIKKQAKGKYIAVCEGDDFWLDSEKLQKQVCFLEKKPDYVVSCHDAIVVDSDGKLLKKSKLPNSAKRDFSKFELQTAEGLLLTLTLVYRNVLPDDPLERKGVRNGDRFTASMLGAYGKAHYQSDISPAVYRVHSNGVWSEKSYLEKSEEHFNTWFSLYRYYKRKNNNEAASVFRNKYQRDVLKVIPVKEVFRELTIRITFFRKLIRFLK
ncbi:glycosyltransferase family 2 protein [Idiomarina sp. Sol25]|uniref:glycosyltransferase family 2 protein n=1 Tax=Idiomarina sp. Sol25 TaxID=3064000 RepID=UPI00294AEF55|nr:glycosyltransferase family 2 protein [Idiomarina sp. Sol25]MDV6328049.1 glycosyltransferase family 2 protein [Idiomarina sp. Sol25]